MRQSAPRFVLRRIFFEISPNPWTQEAGGDPSELRRAIATLSLSPAQAEYPSRMISTATISDKNPITLAHFECSATSAPISNRYDHATASCCFRERSPTRSINERPTPSRHDPALEACRVDL